VTCPPRSTEGTGRAAAAREQGSARRMGLSSLARSLCPVRGLEAACTGGGGSVGGHGEPELPTERPGVLAQRSGEGGVRGRLGGIEDAGLRYFSTFSLAEPGLTSSRGSILEMSPSPPWTMAGEGDPRQPRDAAEGPQGKAGCQPRLQALPGPPPQNQHWGGNWNGRAQGMVPKLCKPEGALGGSEGTGLCVGRRGGRCPHGVTGAQTSEGPRGTCLGCGAGQGSGGSPRKGV